MDMSILITKGKRQLLMKCDILLVSFGLCCFILGAVCFLSHVLNPMTLSGSLFYMSLGLILVSIRYNTVLALIKHHFRFLDLGNITKSTLLDLAQGTSNYSKLTFIIFVLLIFPREEASDLANIFPVEFNIISKKKIRDFFPESKNRSNFGFFSYSNPHFSKAWKFLVTATCKATLRYTYRRFKEKAENLVIISPSVLNFWDLTKKSMKKIISFTSNEWNMSLFKSIKPMKNSEITTKELLKYIENPIFSSAIEKSLNVSIYFFSLRHFTHLNDQKGKLTKNPLLKMIEVRLVKKRKNENNAFHYSSFGYAIFFYYLMKWRFKNSKKYQIFNFNSWIIRLLYIYFYTFSRSNLNKNGENLR